MLQAAEHRRVNHGLREGISQQSMQYRIRGSNRIREDVDVRLQLQAVEWRVV
jgi:hypothetical protein